jgi:hypothetical protein
MKRNEGSLQDSIKRTNIPVVGVQEGLENAKEAESLLKQIIIENFPNLEKETNIHGQKGKRPPVIVVQSFLFLIITFSKVIGNDSQCSKRTSLTDFSAETLQARRE